METLLRAPGLTTCALALALAGCNGDDPLGGACGNCFDAHSGTVDDFGRGRAQGRGLPVRHRRSLQRVGRGAGDLLAACTAIAADLGIDALEPDLVAGGPVDDPGGATGPDATRSTSAAGDHPVVEGDEDRTGERRADPDEISLGEPDAGARLHRRGEAFARRRGNRPDSPGVEVLGGIVAA
jgi:hypothetical protein